MSPTLNIGFVKTHEDAKLPTYGSKEAAGADLYSCEEVVIPAFGRALIKTGLKCNIPSMYEIQVRPRSGLALKRGLTVLNTPGTVDSDYTGELGVILVNHTDSDAVLEKGERIAQVVVAPVIQAEFSWVDETRETERGDGGYGSTGTK